MAGLVGDTSFFVLDIYIYIYIFFFFFFSCPEVLFRGIPENSSAEDNANASFIA